ncbi:hypothetical protein BJF78_30270 [Pseudonocardia sp. CNS-139]|nr:hypothetical protein BJF78_30270 [Pseudonocardia sp. CNS-139]
MVHQLVDRGRAVVDAGTGGMTIAPAAVTSLMSRRWPACSGVSRSSSTSRRRSFSATSAARTTSESS